MPLRKRLGLAAASAVAVAVLASAIVCYVVVRTQLLDQVDGALKAQAIAVRGDTIVALPQVAKPDTTITTSGAEAK